MCELELVLQECDEFSTAYQTDVMVQCCCDTSSKNSILLVLRNLT